MPVAKKPLPTNDLAFDMIRGLCPVLSAPQRDRARTMESTNKVPDFDMCRAAYGLLHANSREDPGRTPSVPSRIDTR